MLDLENTRWGGVVGEGGIGGLKIEDGDLIREGFREFQRVLLDVKVRAYCWRSSARTTLRTSTKRGYPPLTPAAAGKQN